MIREAALTDLAALTDVEAACFGSDAWSAFLVEAELKSDTRSVLLASEDDVVVGYGSIMVVDDVADLQRIGVVSEARRRGLARTLLTELIAKAAGLGATRMLVEVADVNAPAISLYESFGFQVIHRRRGYYANGIDALVMERKLEESA